MNILEDFYNPVVLHPEHSYSASGIYHQIQPTYDLNVSLPPKGLEQVDRMEGLPCEGSRSGPGPGMWGPSITSQCQLGQKVT